MGSSDRFSISSARLWRGIAVALAALLLAAASGTAAAGAATVSKSGSTLTYTAANNETNQTVVSLSGSTYSFSDSGATVAVGSGCTSTGAHSATCAGAGITGITINSGNMNDLAWETAATPVTIFGGDGNDTLIGGNGNDVLIGCTGDDTYNAGGAGADTMVDGAFCAGGGNDTVTYAGRTVPVFVSLDGQANDGQAGEGDNVGADIENIIGTSGDDVIAGGPGDNHIQGGPGNDSIAGEQDPTFDPTVGNDNLEGGDGNDAINGGDGDNQIDGGNGNDSLQGGFGSDRVSAGSGDDHLQIDDGVVDQLLCGPGTDSGTADPDDSISPDCESIDTSGGFDDGSDFGDGGDDFGDLTNQSGGPCAQLQIAQRPVTLHHGVVAIRLSLPLARGSACRGTLKLVDLAPSSRPKKGGGTLKLGSRAFSVRGNKSKRVKVQITPDGRRQILHAGHLTALVKIVPRAKHGAKPPAALITIKT